MFDHFQVFSSYFKSLYRLGLYKVLPLTIIVFSQSLGWGFKRGQATLVHRPHIPLPSSVTKNRSIAEYGVWKRDMRAQMCLCVCVWMSVWLGQLGWQSISFTDNTEPFRSQYCAWFYVLWSNQIPYSKLLRSDQYQTYHLNPLMALDCQSPDILWPHISCPIKPTLAFDLLLLAQVPHGRWKAWPWESGLQWCESFRHVLALLVRIAT